MRTMVRSGKAASFAPTASSDRSVSYVISSRLGAPESPARTSAKKRLSSGAVPPTTTTRLVSG